MSAGKGPASPPLEPGTVWARVYGYWWWQCACSNFGIVASPDYYPAAKSASCEVVCSSCGTKHAQPPSPGRAP